MSRAIAAVYVIFVLSGAAGLGYQIVWTRMLAIGLGHELPSMLAVVAAFFGGLAAGAWALDGRVSRSTRPGRWYAALEIVIAAWAVVLVVLIPTVNTLTQKLIGVDPAPAVQWGLSFAIPFVALFPATAAMGATLPAMERLLGRLAGSGATIGGLYAANTLGAVLGTVLTTFVVAPMIGFSAAALMLAALNIVCAAAVALGPARDEAQREHVVHTFDDAPAPTRLTITLLVTGLLGIGVEIVGVRVISQVLENTVYSFAVALAAYLVATALGAALYQRFVPKRSFVGTLHVLLGCVAASVALMVLILAQSRSMYISCRDTLGTSQAASIVSELLLGLCVFGPPALVMGATFSHLALASRGRTGGVGRAMGLNTLGACLAPPLFGVILLPAVGAAWTLLIIVAGYLALSPGWSTRWPRFAPQAVAIGVGIVAAWTDLVLIRAPRGMEVIEVREGAMASVAVTENEEGGRLLKVNDRFTMGGIVRSFADRRQAHIPLLLHPAPKDVLFLGVGSGVTSGAAVIHPGVEMTGVELVPEVIDLLPYFESGNRLDMIDVEESYVAADARRFVRASDESYDVVVADLFHPGRDGAGALYTVEHFTAIRERLAPNGIFCQWLPIFQLDDPTLRMVLRSYLEVFDDASAWLAHFNTRTPMLALISALEPQAPGFVDARRRADRVLDEELVELGLDNDVELLGCHVADAATLASFAGEGPLNTDDHPRVMFMAPALAYEMNETSWERVFELVQFASGSPGPAVADSADQEDLVSRVSAYRRSRDVFMEGHTWVERGSASDALRLYLSAAGLSADFEAPYVIVLRDAVAMQRTRPDESRRLLRELKRIRPTDHRATRYLLDLFGE